MDDGPEAITDDDVLRTVRRQARRVQWRSVLGAAALTALFVALA
jgi:hypothetical protein